MGSAVSAATSCFRAAWWDYGLVRTAGWADLGLVGRRTVQNGEGAELPAVAVRAHQVSVWRGLGEVGVAVGEGRHIPVCHARTAR